MKVRRKITMVYTLIVGSIVLLSSLYIYSLSNNYSLKLFYTRLKERAFVAANIYFEKDELSPKLYENIQKEFLHSLNSEDIRIYDQANNPIIKDMQNLVKVSIDTINRIREEKYLEFKIGSRQAVGIFYPDNQGDFVIVTSAIDDLGTERIQHLRKVLILNFFLTISIVIVTGRIISNQLLNPMKELIDKVKGITATNLHLRLTESESKDELAELGTTFNQMLLRLEKSFESQKQFIHYASHEFKTPLTSIIGKVDVILGKNRTEEEYRKTLEVVLVEAERLSKLTNDLLALSQINSDENRLWAQQIDIYQLLLTCRADIQAKYQDSKTHLELEPFGADPGSFILQGNEGMLYSAFFNVMENAVKFSGNQPVSLTLEKTSSELILKIRDKGIGLNESDFENIFKPFFRHQDALKFPGSGIGLSITDEVIKLHKGKIRIFSEIGKGTLLELVFPV